MTDSRILPRCVCEKALEIAIQDDELTFQKYPHGSSYLLALRERVNKAIKENI